MASASAEQLRVTDHLMRAEAFAATRDTGQLGPIRSLIRELLLNELADYRAAGRFPKNPGFAELTPSFVDQEGTRCAVAHLLEVGGEHGLVQKIARERNHARVKELADEPRLLSWLEAAGLSVEEAAVIQPSYSCTPAAECVCGRGWGKAEPATAVLEAWMITADTARVEAVYGTTTVRVGDQVKVYAAQGTRVIVGLDAMSLLADGGVNPELLEALSLDSTGKWQCQAQGGTNAPPLTTSEYARFVMASDCLAEVRAMPGLEAGCPIGTGCSSLGDAGSLGVLLAIVGTLLARRLSR